MLSDFRVYVVHLHHRLEFTRGSPRSVRALWDAAPRHAQAVDWVVTGYEIREDFAATAQSNVSMFLGPNILDSYEIKLRDAYEEHDDSGFDRAVLDLPEPWRVVPHLEGSLRTGGILVAYNPSIIQVQAFRKQLSQGPWALVETVEVLHRTRHVEGNAVRPDHRMVAHTGFLTHARLIAS